MPFSIKRVHYGEKGAQFLKLRFDSHALSELALVVNAGKKPRLGRRTRATDSWDSILLSLSADCAHRQFFNSLLANPHKAGGEPCEFGI